MKTLLEVLSDNRLVATWDETEAAGELVPLPAGEYKSRLISGELSTASTGTPGYKLTFEILGGAFNGRRVWHDIWLTPAALPLAKRDLAKLGVTSLAQLEQPVPQGILCDLKISLRREDSGVQYNRLRAFVVTGVEEPDAFAPVGDACTATV